MIDRKPGVRLNLRLGWRWLFLLDVAMTTIAYGSASRFAADAAALTFSVLCLASLAEPLANRRVRDVRTFAMLIAAILCGYAFVQTLPLSPGSPLANAAWRSLHETFGPGQSFISVSPGATREALPSLLLPFLVYSCALGFFDGDAAAVGLWRALAYIGAGCAAFGIAQEALFPHQLLFEVRMHYVGSLTATFVNRNTAGAFFGVALVLNISLLLRELAIRRYSTSSGKRPAMMFLRQVGGREHSRKAPRAPQPR